jgi:hypothetical protein
MARRSQKPPVVFLTGTLTEFVGNRDQPHALFSRAVLFLLGPAGTGKTTVARQYLGFDAPIVRKDEVFQLLVRRILSRSWEETELCYSDSLILEIPSVLGNKQQITKLLTELINERSRLGKRTAILDSEDNASLQGLLASIDSTIRASIVLRFPEGKGRYRFLAHRCREKNIPLRYARRLSQLTPWTYKGALTELEKIEGQQS